MMEMKQSIEFKKEMDALKARYYLNLIGDDLDNESRKTYEAMFDAYLQAKALLNMFTKVAPSNEYQSVIDSFNRIIKKTKNFFEENNAYIIDKEAVVM